LTRDELLQLIADVQQHKSETDAIEVKTARGGTPKRAYEALSAFANHLGGGVILCGLDEEKGFEVVGVGDAHRLQEDISSLAADSMEPALRPTFMIESIEGKTVVAVAIPEIPPEQKPCYYKTAGLQGGSYIRVGNSNRHMTDYEIFGYVSSRKQSKFDKRSSRVRPSTIWTGRSWKIMWRSCVASAPARPTRTSRWSRYLYRGESCAR